MPMNQLPGMSNALAERREHQWWGKKGGQEKYREESIWGWKSRNCNGDAGFEREDIVSIYVGISPGAVHH